MSSHDHYCEKCGVYYSPFDFDTCPCGNEGVYDPNYGHEENNDEETI